MQTTAQILNIDFHRRRLLVKALNKYNQQEAAKKLGVSRRTVCRWLVQYHVAEHEISNQLLLPPSK